MKKATKKATIGEKLCALILSEQLGITMDTALENYVRKVPLHPSWQDAGELLLRSKAGELAAAVAWEASAEEEERPTPGSARSEEPSARQQKNSTQRFR